MITGSAVIATNWVLSNLHNIDYATFSLDSLANAIGEEGNKEHPTMNFRSDDPSSYSDEIRFIRDIKMHLHDVD